MSQYTNLENQILTPNQIRQKIKRIAFEVYEQNFQEKSIFVAGIVGMGYQMAGLLTKELQEISSLAVNLVKVSVDKNAPTQAEVTLDCELESMKEQVVIIVDDVLNTGRTLAYCLKPFLTIHIRKLQVAVLVDRNHRSFPISADYVGYGLSTTVNNHVEVHLGSEPKEGVYLY